MNKRGMMLVALLLAPLARGADAPAPGKESSDEPQVVIEANRTNLTKAGQEVLNLEYRFYDRYNELNTVRKYRIECDKTPYTGWRIKRAPVCKPRFESDAETEAARGWLLAIGSGSGELGAANASPAIEVQRPGLRKNMQEVASKSPELIKLLQDHAAAWRRYTDLYNRLNGRPPVPKDKDPDPAATPPPSPAAPASAP